MKNYVYIVFDDCPSEFGTPKILAVFYGRKLAQIYVQKKKIKDAYTNQYLRVEGKVVRSKL